MRTDTSPPLCLVVNGPSAVGKSTLTTAIQERAEVPLLRFGLDELFRMVPEPWGGGLPGARHADRGFRYEDVHGQDGVRRIRTGVDGSRMLAAMNAAVVAMLESGQGVVVDGQAYETGATRDLEARLRALARGGSAVVAVIELRASDQDLAERQSRHCHPAGLSLFHARQPPQSAAPDLVVDTAGRDAEAVADAVWAWLADVYPPLLGGPA